MSSMISARMNALTGATSDGFSTTVQPAASAYATLAADLVERVVPRRDAADDADRLLHDEAVGVVLELVGGRELGGVAERRRCRCPPGSRPRAASACRPRGSSRRRSRRAAPRAPRPRRSSSLPRSGAGVSDHAGNAALAAATARSMSAGVPAGMVAKTSSVVESITSSVSVPAGVNPRAVDVELVERLHGNSPPAASRRSRRTLPPTGEARTADRRPGSVDLALAALPVGRAQLELLQLAGGGAGQLVAELDAASGTCSARGAPGSGRSGRASRRRRRRGRAPRAPSPSRPTSRRARRSPRPRRPAGCEHSASSTSIDDTFSPPLMITSFLRSEMVQVALVVDDAAVAGVEPAVGDRVGGGVGLLPVPSSTTLLPRQHLALLVERAGARRARAHRRARACVPVPPGVRSSYSARASVDREERRRLGEPVDLDELPAELASRPARWCASAAARPPPRSARVPRPGIGPSHVAARVEHRVHDRRRAAHQRDAVALDPAQDLGAVDLAQHHVLRAHRGDAVRSSPSRCSGTSAACAGTRRGR